MVLPSERGRKPVANRLGLAGLELDLPCSRAAHEEPILPVLARHNLGEGDIFDHEQKEYHPPNGSVAWASVREMRYSVQ